MQDASKMVATDSNGYIWVYNSANSSWVASTYAGTEPWTAVATSADGNVIVVGTGPGQYARTHAQRR